MKKVVFDLIFIAVSAGILLLISNLGYLEKYIALSFLPILCAYFLGQFAERKFRSKEKTEQGS